jgi:bifunctional pyridoxal-dependent enzyme with beta-cystathionase and maltose regulon repressor activities
MSDIVERLEALVIIDEMRSDNQLGKEAAAEIVRLRAEAARNAIAFGEVTRERNEAWMRSAELAAERDRLRDALRPLGDAASERLLEQIGSNDHLILHDCRLTYGDVRRARAALKGDTP